MQSVDGRDIKEGGVLADKSVRTAFLAALKYSRDHARRYHDIPTFAYAVANFQSYKHLHLRGHAKAEAESEFRSRMAKLIAKLNPTHILFSGDLNLLYPVSNAGHKNGWVHTFDNRKVASTIDFSRLLEKNGAMANLLGFWCRHLANLMVGKLPHSVAEVKAKPVYVDTIKKFDKVMALFDTAKLAACDTETKNLSVLANKIYTIQFAFDSDPDRGFVIPIDHPHDKNPFSLEDRKHIKRELQKRFRADHGPTLITMNGMFDLRVIRAALKLDIIYLPVWEVTAGEHLLDENISSLSGLGINSGGLAAIYCAYGNDHYLRETTAFSKNQRGTTGQMDPGDPGFLEYAATDVVSIMHLRSAQIERSAYQDLGNKPYQSYFIRHMMHQMSDTVHHLSHLKDTGSLIDRKYLRSLRSSDSVLARAINDLNDEFKTFPEVQKANAELLEESGFKTGSLFGTKKQWLFSFTKPAHKTKLFFEVMGLAAVSKTPTGADAVDKEFIEHYKDRNFLVEKFGEFQAAVKLLSTYVKGWDKKLSTEIDGATDSHLRADYKFFNVDTGRLASADPNLQNIPARGPLSKIIKEMFVTADGCLLIRFDYSAHEVRGWSIVSGDTMLAGIFKIGQSLRQRWIKTPTQEIKDELKKKGDSHIASVYRFFGKWVDKDHPLRDAVKAVVFGVLYGKSAATLGHDTKKADLSSLKAEMNEAYKKQDPKLKSLEKKFLALIAEDRTEYAQSIIDKMDNEFKRGHQWVVKMQRMATEKFYVYSPIGRIRHLYAAMTQDRQIVSRQVRRGMNAPIQGFASEIAVKAGRLTAVNYYKSLGTLKKMLSIDRKLPPLKQNRIVHDASYYTIPFEMVIPFIHILLWSTTYGIARQYEKEFGLKFLVEPEIEIEVGVRDTKSRKWNYALPELVTIIEQAVDDGVASKMFSKSKDEILELIYAPWRNPKTLDLLDKEYPLLNVSLKKEILDAISNKTAS
jgi:DNA polymerase I-like protein with 3'-5' exonuclease and polymerase domains